MSNDKFVLPQKWDVVMFRSVDNGKVKLNQETIIEENDGGSYRIFWTKGFTFDVKFDEDKNPIRRVAHKLDDMGDAEIIEIWRRTSADVMTCIYRYIKPVIQDIETFADAFRRYD